MSGLFIMDMATIQVGDLNPDDLNHLRLESVKLPTLQEKTQDHTPGGAVMGLQIGMTMLEALNLTFRMKGLNPETSRRLGIGQGRRLNYTLRGNVRDVREDRNFACRVRVNGRMIKVDQSEFARESGINEDFEITEVVLYEVHFDNQEKFFFDFFRGPAGARIDGTPIFSQQAANLGLL